MVMRRLVGAHYGTSQWLRQRLSALIMAVYTVLAVAVLLVARPSTHEDWKALFEPGWVRVITLLFFISLCYHAWVGMRDILMDYVKPTGLRLLLYTAVIVSLAGYAVWAVEIMWRLS
ncbi:MAG: succinate dehydrogenase, hydrophobic membrane anchor protein [Burkholderiales bacterium]|jgi:succinate dehydrogenase, hydrophobic membrane anchor protein|uniref:succinate dehydrogenase, hydrophobic membrane anchor protein n=1 Tax=uncultured Pigmentiphaga sp. TaxID=340361 RepID=UPI00260ED6BD|nr:succinate dehydrogenase, hydrophobic membrane anchor protein [uncultured Pigmentiphaga sp.]MBX6393111.1 succinate dehydrogenase, hydrophobic membrane anchor protein [Burkholderiales bacterium]